jgi:glycosyltransferase involved in cell wall biosynthesis
MFILYATSSPAAMPELLPGVSFVIPVYNKAPYLPKVLAAVRSQAGDFPREYIFIDDGSRDGSLALVRELTASWENVTIFAQANHGSAHATNQGIARARMEFVKFVDADDLLTRRATKTLLEALSPSDACLAWGEVVRYANESEIDLEAFDPTPEITRIEAPLKAALKNSLFNPTQCLARTPAVRAVGGCDERVVFSQEYSLTLRLARLWPFLKVKAKVAFLPRFVPGSLGVDQAKQLKRATMALAYFVRDHPDLPAHYQRFACRRAASRAWRFARRERGSGLDTPWFWRYLRSFPPVAGNHADFIEACASAFDR